MDLLVYPNPVRSDAIIEFNSDIKSGVDIYIYDLAGKLVKSEVRSAQKGLNKISLNFSHLSKGTYVIQLVSGKRKYTSKFLIN